MDLVSKILIPKLSPNHVGIGSRTERLRVLKRGKLKNSLRFSFLLLITHWFADRLSQVLYSKNWFDILFRGQSENPVGMLNLHCKFA